MTGTVEIEVTGRGSATPEQVYGTLADLASHLDWGGRRQPRWARIRSLDAPPGPAVAGTTFSSVGGFPGWRLSERHVVTDAQASRVFAFETITSAEGRGSGWTAAFRHRYTIDPEASGSRVTYRFEQTRIDDPPLRFRGVFAPLSYAMVRRIAQRGVRNLLAAARER